MANRTENSWSNEIDGQKISLHGSYQVESISILKDKISGAPINRTVFVLRENSCPTLENRRCLKKFCLETSRLHPVLETGKTFTLDVELFKATSKGHQPLPEAMQVLLQVPQGNSMLPLWVLSHRAPSIRLNSVRFFQMQHSDVHLL